MQNIFFTCSSAEDNVTYFILWYCDCTAIGILEQIFVYLEELKGSVYLPCNGIAGSCDSSVSGS